MSCPLDACTVFSKCNIAKARVLHRSFMSQHPNSRFIGLLMDDPTDCFDPDKESFPILRVEDLEIPNLDGMRMRYDVVELCSAVRPWFILHLFEEGFDRVAYIDPDILIFRPLSTVESMLADASTILSPHLTAPLPDDGCLPDERTILQSGAFNSGFIAFKNNDASRALLEWWKGKLERHAHMDPASGLFGDQRWMDLMPGMFEGVAILRDPTTNVAYWNLHERTLTSFFDKYRTPQQRFDLRQAQVALKYSKGENRCGTTNDDRRFSNRLCGEDEGGLSNRLCGEDERGLSNRLCGENNECPLPKCYLINNEPLTFFHFSGYKPELPDQISTHQTRFQLREITPLADLCDHYRSLLHEAGHEITKQWKYTFDHFENGVPIVPAIRRIFDSIDGETQFARPFDTENPTSFFGWLTSPATAMVQSGFLMNLHIAIHKISTEASARFLHPLGADRNAFAQWLLAWEQQKQFRLPAVFTDCLKPLAGSAPRRPLKESLHSFLIRRHDWQPYQQCCKLMRKVIGNRRFERWKPNAPAVKTQPFVRR